MKIVTYQWELLRQKFLSGIIDEYTPDVLYLGKDGSYDVFTGNVKTST
ncbi:MAG: hypothetical protein ACTS8R_01980 [Arsenophonus sp. NC-QC1-MAG3]